MIERSFEFYALAASNDTIGDFDDHTEAYRRAFELGLLSADLRDDYQALYEEHRTESYYGNDAFSDPDPVGNSAPTDAADDHDLIAGDQ